MYMHNNRVVFERCLADENGRACIETILNAFYKLFKIPAKPLRLGVPYRTCIWTLEWSI